MDCKCGQPMTWMYGSGGNESYRCNHCDRLASLRFDGSIKWWVVEAVEPYTGD